MTLSREGMLDLFRAAEEQSGIFFRTVTADRAVRGRFPYVVARTAAPIILARGRIIDYPVVREK